MAPQYYLSVLVMFKNEASGIREWMQHYVDEGVDHFYMIDNGSTDDYESQIRQFVDAGRVTLWKDASKHAQVRLYNELMMPHARETEWLLVCDIDEFVYAPTGTIPDYLKTVDPDVGAIIMRWIMFGSSGLIEQPASVVDSFTWRASKPWTRSTYFKSITRTSMLDRLELHWHDLKPGARTLNVSGEVGDEEAEAASIAKAPLRLNHYAIQSWDWFQRVKMTRGDGYHQANENVRDEAYFKEYDRNDVEDTDLKQKRARNKIERFVGFESTEWGWGSWIAWIACVLAIAVLVTTIIRKIRKS